jgi:hypothetical protein
MRSRREKVFGPGRTVPRIATPRTASRPASDTRTTPAGMGLWRFWSVECMCWSLCAAVFAARCCVASVSRRALPPGVPPETGAGPGWFGSGSKGRVKGVLVIAGPGRDGG